MRAWLVAASSTLWPWNTPMSRTIWPIVAQAPLRAHWSLFVTGGLPPLGGSGDVCRMIQPLQAPAPGLHAGSAVYVSLSAPLPPGPGAYTEPGDPVYEPMRIGSSAALSLEKSSVKTGVPG